MPNKAISVRQLNLYVKGLIEGDSRLSFVSVAGEISNFKNHLSGHWYFTLKDKDAAIRCVMFKPSNKNVNFVPEDGASVVLSGRVSLYEKEGQFQFYAEQMHIDGEGDLSVHFKLVKEKLEKEGLFDLSSKRQIPKFPKKIAVVTSSQGAALQDILNITNRRYPICEMLVCPVSVQGKNAVKEMLLALGHIYELDGIDLIIIGRGGGSAEDLEQYNDEMLARKIYESPVPVISAIGHETDFTICDFVADLRAPTPSAAAELAVPDREMLLRHIDNLKSSLSMNLTSVYENSKLKFEKLTSLNRNIFLSIIQSREAKLNNFSTRIKAAAELAYEKKSTVLQTQISSLDALSPLKVMSRGYAAVSKNGTTLKTVNNVSVGEQISVRFSDGRLDCSVMSVEKE